MKYYVQSEYKMLIWLLAGLLFMMGILMLIYVSYEGFIILGVSLLFFGLGFIFNINTVTLTDEAILLHFVRFKKKIEWETVTSIRIYKGHSLFSVNQIVITTNHIPDIEIDVSMFQFVKYCKQAQIPTYLIGYHKRLVKDLESRGFKQIK